MLRDITIGQYYPVDSYIHRLDARLKIVCAFLYIMSLFLIKNIFAYGIVIAFLAVVIHASGVPLRFMLKGLKSIVMIIFFTVVINIFLTPGKIILFQYAFITITFEGLYFAVLMAIRLILLIIGSSILTLTTSPIELTDGIEFLLAPLKKIGVPAHEIAMMMTIALRFIPTLMEETDKIMKAQQARGADFETGNFIKRAKSLIPILVPLFISAFRRADDLATAMEARCYNGDKNRTRMKEMKFVQSDYKSFAFVFFYLVCTVCARFILKG